MIQFCLHSRLSCEPMSGRRARFRQDKVGLTACGTLSDLQIWTSLHHSQTPERGKLHNPLLNECGQTHTVPAVITFVRDRNTMSFVKLHWMRRPSGL